MRLKKLILLPAAFSAVFFIAACSPAAKPGAEPTASAAPTGGASPSSEPSVQPTETPIELPTVDTIGCDTMLEPLFDEALRSVRLQPAPKPWTQFGFEPSLAAIECPWGYEGQMHSTTYYAWTALADGEREQFLDLTAENGYQVEEDTRGTWIVSPAEAQTEEMEILVTEDWIAFAPTRELVSVIVWTH